jgi:head-tail adaptor
MAKRQITGGDLRERFQLEADSNFGLYTSGQENTPDWNAVANYESVAAMIRPENEFERIRAGRTEAHESLKITTRSEIPITPKNRIVWDSTNYQVVTTPVTIDFRRRFQRFIVVRTDA